jgi:hypothetical protein
MAYDSNRQRVKFGAERRRVEENSGRKYVEKVVTRILYAQMSLGRHRSPRGVCPTKVVALSPSLIAVPYPSIVTVDFSKDLLYMVFQ